MKILVTGFEPFGGEVSNPSAEVVKGLPKEIDGAKIYTLILPVVQGKASAALRKAVEDLKPDAVLSVGQAGGRSAVCVERVAVNLDDYRIPDNEENQPVDEPVVSGGPDGYFSTLPVKKIAEAIRKEGIPAQQSLSAGTFVCNHVLYSTLHLAAQKYPEMKAGFIHIPYLPEQAADKPGMPSMSLELSARAVELAIKCVINEKEPTSR